MDIKEEILAQMDSALRPEFDKAIDNTIEGAFKEDVKTLGFMVANSIKCQWEVMKPHLFYAYCLGVKAQEAKAQAVPECTWSHDSDEDMYGTWHTKCGNAFVLNEDGPTENQMNYCCYCGGKLIEAQEPAND